MNFFHIRKLHQKDQLEDQDYFKGQHINFFGIGIV